MQAQLDEMQVRAICVQIAYHSKLGVSSLSGDSKNAHHSPALTRPMRSFTSIQMFHTHTHTHCQSLVILQPEDATSRQSQAA